MLQNQSNHIPFEQPSHLAFPDHVHRFIALNRPAGSVEGPKPPAGVNPSFDSPVVLLHDVVLVGTRATATAPAQFPAVSSSATVLGYDGLPSILITRVRGWPGARKAFWKKRFGFRVTVSGEQKFNGRAGGIDGTVQLNPLAQHPNVGLIHPPGAVGGLQFPPASLFNSGA